jgi:iron complex outermembrane receptor protein
MPFVKSSQLIAVLSVGLALRAAGAGAQTPDLSKVTIEDLMKIQVTSVSKKPQELFGTPSAVFVLTNEAIRRSGVTTIPDALRLVPGIQVAQIDGNKWAITARGFNGLWANKLLVLVDGRVVYTPVSGGVNWDVQDFLLDDIDRIEVIRGPGSTVWGTNAVNGVINIISKSSASTQGGLVSVSTGSQDPAIESFRYGGRVGGHGHYRLFMKQSNHGELADANGNAAHDQSRLTRAGFRSDLDLTPIDSLTFEGSVIDGESGQRINSFAGGGAPPVVVSTNAPIRAFSLVGRWQRTSSPHSAFSVQAFWDRSNRRVLGLGDQTTHTFDLELQDHVTIGPRNDLVWGAGGRVWGDRQEVVLGGPFDPPSSRSRLFNAFVQDEFALVPGRLNLTLGSKLEHNSTAGFEPQPTARIAWLPTARQTVWSAVSGAVRTPSRLERALHLDIPAFPGPTGQLIAVRYRGGADLKTEHTNVFEVGYRAEPHSGLALDVSAFYNDYENLRTENAVMSFERDPGPPHAVLTHQYADGMNGKSAGVELLGRWQATRKWRIDAQYDRLHTVLKNIGTTSDATILSMRDPNQQWQVRSQVNLTAAWQLDASLARVGRLHSVNVPAYSRVDMRVGGTLTPGIAVALVGQNLLEARHWEFGGPDGVLLSEVRRSASLQLTWQF